MASIETAPEVPEETHPTETTTEVQEFNPETPAGVTWKVLRDAGYSKIHTAAILGNLQQEHNFKTDDVPGGLGIAQWMGARRDRLMAKEGYQTIEVQAQFIVEELNSTESRAGQIFNSQSTIEDATLAFQNHYERCHVDYCHGSQRIQYAINHFNNFNY